jgi:molybdopterin converting factor subunit 1
MNAHIKIPVYLFAQVRELARETHTDFEIEKGTDVSGLVELLHARFPSLLSVEFKVAVNKEYADDDRVLVEGDEVAIIPPISGG